MYCKNCECWIPYDEDTSNDDIGRCEHPKIFCYQEDEKLEDVPLDSLFYTDPDTSYATYTGKNFGCIHFSPRGDGNV